MDTGFLWDGDKRKKVFTIHGVAFHEVVAAFEDEDGFDVEDPQGHQDRFLMVASTASSRLLAVVYEVEDQEIYRIVTAFDAEGAYRDEYYNRP